MVPLSEQLRPKNISEFIGQEHIVGEGSVLAHQIDQKSIISMILFGPPGTGKTTLAQIISNSINSKFVSYSAIAGKVAEIRKIISDAQKDKIENNLETILFIDEIHRFSKSQQDNFLHAVETGSIVLIGATTENPGFSIISPLLSRVNVYQFHPLTDLDLELIIQKVLALDPEIQITPDASRALIGIVNGDARKLINYLELLIKSSKQIDRVLITKILNRKFINYDKSADNHFDTISAFIKCMRSGDPDATLHYLARMIIAGEDPLFIARRMVIFASEDIGNAKPAAFLMATSCFQAVQVIGMPESQILLAQCATYLATSPKSIASYVGIKEAIEDIEKNSLMPIPLHLKNIKNKFDATLGNSKDYVRYPWLDKTKVRPASNLPSNLVGRKYYRLDELSE